MKIYLILILSTLVGCSSYTVTKVKDDQVMISKTTQVLFFWGGTISTCDLDKDGLFKKCEENVIQGEEVLKKPIVEKPVIPVIVEKSMPIKEEVKKNEIVKKEPVPVIEKPIMVQKKDMDKNKIYIGLGISTIDEPDLGKDLDSVKFNYSFAYLKKESDYMYGVIYHISAYRVYGSLTNGTNPQTYTAYELQSNINILGATVRKYLGSTDGSSPYVRVDGGLAWQTMGKSVVLMPLEDSNGMSLGGNIGAGISIKTGFGSINIDVYHTIYSPPESAKIDSGMTNFTLGMMF